MTENIYRCLEERLSHSIDNNRINTLGQDAFIMLKVQTVNLNWSTVNEDEDVWIKKRSKSLWKPDQVGLWNSKQEHWILVSCLNMLCFQKGHLGCYLEKRRSAEKWRVLCCSSWRLLHWFRKVGRWMDDGGGRSCGSSKRSRPSRPVQQ